MERVGAGLLGILVAAALAGPPHQGAAAQVAPVLSVNQDRFALDGQPFDIRTPGDDVEQGVLHDSAAPGGPYVIIVTANSFRTTTLENIEVTAGATVRVAA